VAKFALCLFIAFVTSAHGDGLPLPAYPPAALRAHQGGKVQIKVTYDEHGGVKAVDILSSSGVPLLDTATKKFVLGHWQNPAMANQTMNFTMSYNPSDAGPSVDKDAFPVNPDPNALTARLPALAKPQDDPLDLYKKHIQAVVAYYWGYEVKKHAADLEAGTVKMKYVIHSDGTISDIVVLDGTGFEVLKQVGENVLIAGMPYRPFTPDLIAEVGDQYTDTRTFTIAR
jgi:TonB family protein